MYIYFYFCLIIYRNQSADLRPTFTTVVDELLAIQDELPQQSNTKVIL